MRRRPPRVRRSSYDRALPCWHRRPYSPPRSYLGAVSRPCGPGSLRAGSSCRSGMGPPAQCTVDPWLVCRSVPFPRLPNSPRCGLLRDRFRYRFRPEGDLARGERASGAGKEPADIQGTGSMPQENGRPLRGGRSNDRNDAARSGAGAQPKFRDPDRKIESDRAVHRDRLQRHGAVGAADEAIGAEAGSNGHLATRAKIVAGEKAGIGANAVREHAPYHDAAAGDADVEAELADRSAIDLLRAGRLRSVYARHRFLRSDDEPDAG